MVGHWIAEVCRRGSKILEKYSRDRRRFLRKVRRWESGERRRNRRRVVAGWVFEGLELGDHRQEREQGRRGDRGCRCICRWRGRRRCRLCCLRELGERGGRGGGGEGGKGRLALLGLGKVRVVVRDGGS